MARCRRRRGRLFYSLQLRGVTSAMRIEQVQQAFLICVPKSCNEEATRGWISAALMLGPVKLQIPELSTCGGAGNLILPPRLGLPTEVDRGLHHYVTAGGTTDWGLSYVYFGGQPKIYTTLELRVPKPALLEPQQRRKGVAVLFAGSWRFSQRTAFGIQRHVLQPLKALAFAASHGSRIGVWSSCELLCRPKL
eukprot:symbB.v1.2.025272.t1/scaffold2439.1/size78980/4